jgi:hypothetical protein
VQNDYDRKNVARFTDFSEKGCAIVFVGALLALGVGGCGIILLSMLFR